MFLRLVRRSDVSVAALIPNMLTTVALCCGLASIHFSAKAAVTAATLRGQGAAEDIIQASVLGLWERALAAILLSAIFDALDGRAARLLRVTSKFGAVLDSLSDFVAFGVAPAMILHEWTLWRLIAPGGPRGGNIFALMAVVTFALCSGLRLARFTAATPPPKPSHSNFFVGMPTPAAAGAVLIPAMLDASKTIAWKPPAWMVILYTLLIAFLMISRIPMFSLKKIRVSRYVVAPLLALVGVLVATMVYDPWLTISILAGAYLLSLPLAAIARQRQRQHEPEVSSEGVGVA